MFATGNEVKAIKIKGTEYFSFASNIAEPLKFANKQGKGSVFTCGEFILNYYNIEGNSIDDIFKYNSPAEVLDILVHKLDGASSYLILSCKDRGVRVLN